MASMTARGFCAVAALSRYTNFLPRISRERMGKSRRIFSTSNPVPTTCSRWAADSLDGILAAVVIRSPPRSFRYLRWMSRLRRCSPNLPLAADNCESIFQLARVRALASSGPGTRSQKQRAGACVPRARRFRVSGDRTARSRRSGQWLLVGTLHIVGVNLELRLCVDLRVVGEQQVTVRLLGVGFLGIFVNNNAPVKHAMRAVIQDAVIELAAVAVWAGVLHQHVVIEVLLAIADEEAINQALSAFSSQYGMDVVAHQSSAKKYRV